MSDFCHCPRCRPLLVARWDGAPCPKCGHRVMEGDFITTLDGDVWVHDDCADKDA